MSCYRVFVYGTLKRGEPNYHVIDNPTNGVSHFIGEGKTVAKYPMVAAAPWYNPYLLSAENQDNAKVVRCSNMVHKLGLNLAHMFTGQ
jgi:gamma-glutamylaminecyclotransferase